MKVLELIKIKSSDGFAFRCLTNIKSGTPKRPTVILFHEILGFQDEGIINIANVFHEHNYNVLIPNLFERNSTPLFCILKSIISIRSGKGDIFRDIRSSVEWLENQPSVSKELIGVAGFCMGGGFAVLTSINPRIKVCGAFYSEIPEDLSFVRDACPIVSGYGNKDLIHKGKGRKLQQALTEFGVQHDIKFYPEAGHAYMTATGNRLIEKFFAITPLRVGPNKRASVDSWDRIFQYFDKYLSLPET